MKEPITFPTCCNPRPVVAVATHAHWVVDFDVHFNHITAMCHWSKAFEIKSLGLKGLQAAEARNKMVSVAIEQGCSHILFLDADHIVPTEMLPLLWESQHEAMVSGLITKRGYPYQQVVWLKDKNNMYVETELPIDGNVYEVGVCAFGCTLINLKMLQDLPQPYFRDTCVPGPANDGKFYNIRSDINVCNMLREKGHRVWVDTRILIGHQTQGGVVYPQNAKTYREMFENVHRDVKLQGENKNGFYYEPYAVELGNQGTSGSPEIKCDDQSREVGHK